MKLRHITVVLAMLLFGISLAFSVLRPHTLKSDWPEGTALPQPSSMSNSGFEKILYPWLQARKYATLDGWAVDKRVRDTGPFIEDTYYGVHPAVRMYYSPSMIQWLRKGRVGNPPNGSIIIKEMFAAPAIKYRGLTDAQLADILAVKGMWTVMIRDSGATWDGWYWGAYNTGQAVDDPAYYDPEKGFRPAHSGFATYCLRCHSAPEDDLTFSALANVKGEAGNPIQYAYDDTWMPKDPNPDDFYGDHSPWFHDLQLPTGLVKLKKRLAEKHSNYANFTQFFTEMNPVPRQDVEAIPPRTFDHVTSLPSGPLQFISSDNCMPCHSGSNSKAYGVNMFIPDEEAPGGKGWNVSPYGEWQGSMMGLAGRDPIFFAQLESEMTVHHQDTLPDFLQNTCLQCHGVMGQRQFHIDDKGHFYQEKYVMETGDDPYSLYGSLSRDGISCMVCHQIVNENEPLLDIATGNFNVSTPGEFEKQDGKDISWIYGPYEEVSTHPMMEGLGIRPKYSSFIKESRLCSSCHTVYLPVFKADGQPVKDTKDPTGMKHVFEQATYLEWQNSGYQNEVQPYGKDVKTCQTCHMPSSFPYDASGKPITNTQIANVQDQSYPMADHLAPFDSLFVERRDTFHRHTLLGINQFGLEMFNQFDSILGIYKYDYMTGTPVIPQAIHASQVLATQNTAEVSISSLSQKGTTLDAEVNVTSLVGHRFPSGVGFRRAFLEFRVLDAKGKELWVSGKTNSLGVILGPDGQPLPSEFFDEDPKTGKQAYQEHHRVISRQDQVQIYQELVKNPEGRFTTSFIAIDEHVKDNRLLPMGWSRKPVAISDKKQIEATMPKGEAENDKDFGAGGDKVRYRVTLPAGVQAASVEATLYYQSIPPYYLKDRFMTAKGSAGQRLYYLASNLNLRKTNIKNWKLKVASGTRAM